MPTKAEKPAPNRLSARPVAYWLVLSQITSTPNAAASTAPATAPAPKASQSLPVWTAVAKPAIAATSIMPSAPRLTMPARSLISRPSAGEREHRAGVERRGDEERELVHQVPSVPAASSTRRRVERRVVERAAPRAARTRGCQRTR